ncbi:hypothetical protein PORY_000843 [Pneumocystis oryctolagi]|uniref:Uncharacterized protein n=1 Tax=Pneumocystis oryctolagi TaxID=42067 RepID=A0ACB7CG20_9ASCO|nr:hypothetical protein PORY_000843 [Pneumocystis oryctolagi]
MFWITLQRSTLLRNSTFSGRYLYSTKVFSNGTYISEQDAVKEHAGKTAELWKKISIFVCIPALILSGINALQLYLKHQEHLSHMLEEQENDTTLEYPYQNIRSKRFFWGDGDKTLFWNDRVNVSFL